MSNILLEDIFNVKEINPDGDYFEIVSRIVATSESYEMEMYLDINTQLYPVEENSKFTIVLASSLFNEVDRDPEEYIRQDFSAPGSLADKFEYVMFGRIFKCEEEERDKLTLYVSFGGLLMRLKGEARNLEGIEIDNRIYLLMRRSGVLDL
ncbi:DNA-directed RNA polymerases I, II, and III subunit RPABC3-like [Zophobas morio]|uniref:DNA-directed RNA polymerases I, II, and III subunit RPABC3-like n=1 Tax=Zophobas morio TaxID=2755281 RepID=UPI00308373AE